MTLPRLCSEGVKALSKLARRSETQARQSILTASLLQGRAYAAEPVPAEGDFLCKSIVTNDSLNGKGRNLPVCVKLDKVEL
jgi:hypothetical protein